VRFILFTRGRKKEEKGGWKEKRKEEKEGNGKESGRMKPKDP